MGKEDIMVVILMGVPMVFLFIWVPERLHSTEPMHRLRIAFLFIGGAILLILGLIAISERPEWLQAAFIQQAAFMAMFYGVILCAMLSARLIFSSVLQSFQRWRYRRRNGS
ncbi:MAG: hypothetical protein KKE77_02390 [Alphaproteobacteria bacterium]|nr:hypothetical protein [Alphaproteobacteria bacterium]